jgi:hypothetical protein
MAKRAGADKLGLLHEKLAEVMLDALDGEKITDEEGNETVFKATNPALFTAIAKFLKDNDIVAIPETDDAVKRLKDKLLANNKSTLPLPSKEDIQWHNGNQPH